MFKGKGKNMKLRRLEKKDASFMLEWMHDTNVTVGFQKNFGQKTLADCEEFIEAAQNSENDLHLAAVDDNDEYMGTVSLKNIRNKSAEFAITFRSCAMGKGFSQIAMAEIIRRGFEELGLEKIYWCVLKDNARAIRFYDKNGYSRTNDVPAEIYGGIHCPYTDNQLESFIWYEVFNF